MRLAFALIALTFLAGCTQPVSDAGGQTTTTQPPAPTSEPAVKEFNVTISHTSYSPASFRVNVGDTVRIYAVAAPGTASHNHGITIDEYNVNVAVTSETNPAQIVFVADRAGTFDIWCKTCWDGPFGKGHPDIRATLVVK